MKVDGPLDGIGSGPERLSTLDVAGSIPVSRSFLQEFRASRILAVSVRFQVKGPVHGELHHFAAIGVWYSPRHYPQPHYYDARRRDRIKLDTLPGPSIRIW